MSRTPSTKSQLIQAISDAMRHVSAQSVLVSNAVAEKVGLSSSDLECLDYVMMADGAATPSLLAEKTGLTSGAITGVIDRLERAGFVTRTATSQDRRKVLVVANEDAVQLAGRYYERLLASTTALWSKYTLDELRLVLDFMTRNSEVVARELEHIRKLRSPQR
jgi:DNA-binding MarR family transcriptional regulator